MTDYIIDIETDGIDATKIHCMSVHNVEGWNGVHDWTATTYQSMRGFFRLVTSDDRIIGHNFIRYDKPTLERLLDIKIQAQIVDTLALSWYLTPEIQKHGLDPWGDRLDISKPKVDDWENASLETYVNRCKEDVKINHKLWMFQESMLETLYDNDYGRLIDYLEHKMNCAALAEKCMWKLDVDKAQVFAEDLDARYKVMSDKLASRMPLVPIYVKLNKPAKPYKKDGTLSAAQVRYDEIINTKKLSDCGTKFVKGYKEPNPSSIKQIKDWLFSIGWEPVTFDYNNSQYADGRQVPQIKGFDGELCASVIKLQDTDEAVMSLREMTILKHRSALVHGLLKNANDDGFVKAQMMGLTNTLRLKHTVCVNIPSVRKPYGKEIRELLTVRRTNHTLCGSDMASLEDRTKQHYMYKHDPEFVEDMMVEGFDPHLDLALSAGAVTQEQVDEYKAGVEHKEVVAIRHAYKGGNYACTYGAGAKTLSIQLAISEKEAGVIHRAYWKRNWSLKNIAKEVKVKKCGYLKGGAAKMWLYNEVSQLYYFLKSDKDKFSTLNQGTGTYCFDMWLKEIITSRPQITGQFHDEVILELQDHKKEEVTILLKEAIQKVNKQLSMNRDLDCDIKFGADYSQIH